jgi:16S rRNA (adenine1518-N6/adenine1519-N6)-dimethyltransferase
VKKNKKYSPLVEQQGQSLHARKSMGQHFLHNRAIIDDMIAAIPEKENHQILEVGPGPGALTSHLIRNKNITFLCIELDSEKVDFLRKTYPKEESKIIHGDFLKMQPPFEDAFSVIGNFPYNISTQIIFRVIDWRDQVDICIGMFQKEVAKRIASKHGCKDYGIQSVLTQIYYDVTYLFDVGPEQFTPPPKVQSGVIKLIRNDNPFKILDYLDFKTFIKAAFSQRRKTLRNCFKSFLSQEILSDVQFNNRAEQLSVADFVDLYNRVWLKKD